MPLVELDQVTFTRISNYAKLAKLSADRAVTEAVNEWMDSDGELLIQMYNKKKKSKRTRKGSLRPSKLSFSAVAEATPIDSSTKYRIAHPVPCGPGVREAAST